MTRTFRSGLVACGIVVAVLVLGGHPASAQVPQQHCGNEGEAPCPVPTPTNAPCDTGLDNRVRTCGCLLRGFFGNCLIPQICFRCEADERRRASIGAFSTSWADWALRNQRELALDEPLNWVMHLGTHNSYNSWSDGHLVTNHFYSMTDQLRSGGRLLTLDLFFLAGDARLCHGGNPTGAVFACPAPGHETLSIFPPGLRYFANGIKEIRNWLQQAPEEVVVIGLENWVLTDGPGGVGSAADVVLPLQTYFGSQVLQSPLSPPVGFTETRWPTRREMLAAGKRVIVFNDSALMSHPLLFPQGEVADGVTANDQPRFPNCPATNIASSESAVAFNAQVSTGLFTVAGLDLADDNRVRLAPAPGAPLPPGFAENTTYFAVNVTASAGDPASQTFQLAARRGGTPLEVLADASGMLRRLILSTRFSFVVEDRSGLPGTGEIGVLEPGDVTAAVECNQSLVAMDFLSSSLPFGRVADVPDFSRQASAVWSWRTNDRGQHGDCAALEGDSGRWASTGCQVARQYTCARPRSESGLDPLEWPDPLGEDWKITAASGPWEDGHAACRSEFPGYAFSVPVNGYQNRRLREANNALVDLWLNYSQRDVRGRWVIGRVADANAPPIADAGPDQELECGATVTLSAASSGDPDGDTLTYTWTGSFGTLTGPVISPPLGLGQHAILLTVDDGRGGTDTDSVTVTIRDTQAPHIELALSSTIQRTVKGTLAFVIASVDATDGCDDEPPAIELVSVVGEDGAPTDLRGAEPGTDARKFVIRVPDGGNSVRVYTVLYRATDSSGNTADATAQVTIPPGGGAPL